MHNFLTRHIKWDRDANPTARFRVRLIYNLRHEPAGGSTYNTKVGYWRWFNMAWSYFNAVKKGASAKEWISGLPMFLLMLF